MKNDYSLIFPTEIKTDHEAISAKFAELYQFLCSENLKYNLTRITDEKDFRIKHVYDSMLPLAAFPEYFNQNIRIADIGCGAGFPSLIIASTCPNAHITAIDSRGKKIQFVRNAAELLELPNITAVAKRARELASDETYRNSFDLITARAVASIKTIFKETRRLLKPNGVYMLFKTPEAADEEICEVRGISEKYGFTWELSKTFSLPDEKGLRVIVLGKKDSI